VLIKIKSLSDAHLLEVVKGGSINFIFKILSMLFSYLAILWITNNHGAEEFGKYSIGITVLSIATIIPIFGLDQGLVRIIGELLEKNSLNKISNVLKKSIILVVSISLIVSVYLYFQSKNISLLLKNPELEQTLKIAIYAIIPTVLIRVFSAVMQSVKKITQFSIVSLLLTPCLFFLALVVSDFYVLNISILPLYVMSVCVSALIALVIFMKLLPSLDNEKRIYPYPFKKIVEISLPMLLVSSFALIMSWTDVLMLSYYMTAADVGVYTVAVKVALIASIGLSSINSIVAPKLVQSFSSGNLKDLEVIVQQSTRVVFFVSLPIIVFIFIFSNVIMELFGQEFSAGVVALLLISFAQLVNSISGSVGYIMQMTNNQKIFQFIIIFSAILNIVMNYFLIPIYGINGAAFSSMISMITWNVMSVIFIKNKLGFWSIYMPNKIKLL
jgi:O-antigen/teichoic acid export membrane protein